MDQLAPELTTALAVPIGDNTFVQLVFTFHHLRTRADDIGMANMLSEIGISDHEIDSIVQAALQQAGEPPTKEEIERIMLEMLRIQNQFTTGNITRPQRRQLLRTNENLFGAARLVYPGWPKNKLAWYFLRYALGKECFSFEIEPEARHEHGLNRINFPTTMSDASGHCLSPLLIASGLVDSIGGIPDHIIRKSQRLLQLLGRDIGSSLISAMLRAKIIFPPSKILEQLAAAVQRGLRGETVIITGVFCPDYSYEPTGNLTAPYRYTFDGLGTGVGLVAQQFVRMLPMVAKFFDQHGIGYRVVLSIGDFECNSAEICRRVGCNRDEFIRRCEQSLEKFQQSIPDIPLELSLFERDWTNGSWLPFRWEAYNRMRRGDFGLIQSHTGKDPDREVRFIAHDGSSFYDTWYGRSHSEAELQQLVIEQAAEYAAVGRIITATFPDHPIIQLAGDRPKMQIFSSMYQGTDFPILCAERTY